MKKYKCTVAYVGANYSGWQSQLNGRSIQEQIEFVIRNITHEKINITASGRTDAGVNAKGQVFMFESNLEMTERKWMGAINGFLPNDIHILNVEEVNPHLFHSRYNVRMKHYDYCIQTGAYDVFTKDTAYQYCAPLDYKKMVEASKYLIGTHDFTSLNSNSLKEKPNQVRTIFDIRFSKEGDLIRISYYGKGFLRYMVRMMTAELMEVGKGAIQPEDIQKILDARSKTISRKNAPANGLTLMEVDYFEMLALNEQGMVREFLHGDDISFLPVSFEQLERQREEKKDSWYFAFTGRHDQNIRGYFEVDHDKTILHIFDEEDFLIAESLQKDLNAWMEKENRNSKLKIRLN